MTDLNKWINAINPDNNIAISQREIIVRSILDDQSWERRKLLVKIKINKQLNLFD